MLTNPSPECPILDCRKLALANEKVRSEVFFLVVPTNQVQRHKGQPGSLSVKSFFTVRRAKMEKSGENGKNVFRFQGISGGVCCG